MTYRDEVSSELRGQPQAWRFCAARAQRPGRPGRAAGSGNLPTSDAASDDARDTPRPLRSVIPIPHPDDRSAFNACGEHRDSAIVDRHVVRRSGVVGRRPIPRLE